MMNRRVLLTVVSVGIATAPFMTQAQAARGMARIGYLGVNRPEQVQHLLAALRSGLRELGWIEGQNIHIEYRWAEGALDRLARLADELVSLRIDVLVAPATQSIKAAQRATHEIPILMIGSNDPVSDGFVTSLARPGGNITGLTFDPGVEIGGKHIELLVQVIPTLSRVAVLVNPTNPGHTRMSEGIRVAAQSFGVQLELLEARSPQGINDALVEAKKRHVGALVIHSDPMLFGERRRIVDLASKARLPTIYPWREAADDGGLMTCGASLVDNFRRAASFIDRILKGAKPAELPVEQPTKFELVVNAKTARALGLTIPQSVLARADRVI